MATLDPFNARQALSVGGDYYSLDALDANGVPTAHLPYSVRILLEGALRCHDGFLITEEDIRKIAAWTPDGERGEIPFRPSRVILQDFTGVPAVVDLAALRDAMVEMGGDPEKVNPQVPVDLVIDHSVQVDVSGAHSDALDMNLDIEYHRNMERYTFLKWGQQSLANFQAVPPSRGIVHQVNLEFLASVARQEDGVWLADTLVGTDSHTTMVNGLGVLGWGVGGIEAEAVMLGQPIYMLAPDVVGVRLTGGLQPGVTATDMTLRIVEMLREHGVVGKFVEFFGPGMKVLSLADRATIANMAPEYGATCGFFPVDERTLEYLRLTGREDAAVEGVEAYAKAQGLWCGEDAAEKSYTAVLALNLDEVVPALAGPKRPQDRVDLKDMKAHFIESLTHEEGHHGHGLTESDLSKGAIVEMNGEMFDLNHGDVVIAAITSCTNTSNPGVMLAAGLLARKARQRGLTVKPWVRTSLAPGSRVVTEYYEATGLQDDLNAMGFHTVGYGCTTCIGNSGPLDDPIEAAIDEAGLIVGSVLSGNRNFEGRVHGKVKASYLASPPLVVAYAIAGNLEVDLTTEPIGHDSDGQPVMLSEVWPSDEEVAEAMKVITPDMFRQRYADAMNEPRWNSIPAEPSPLYPWEDSSTYIRLPTFFSGLSPTPNPILSIERAKVLLKLGDSITTDHISPAGSLPADGPAGQWLVEREVKRADFNSFGSRRGNHEVMMRGTFANVRIRNQMAQGTEGGYALNHETGEVMSVYEAAQIAAPKVVLAGSQYGTGSSRDWAAKGTYLLGVKAVIATSFERIHRSNLVGMGVLPLTFKPGESHETLGLTGHESFTIPLTNDVQPLQWVTVHAEADDGVTTTFEAQIRLDTPVEVEYYRNGGILHTVLREMAQPSA
ncbi:MAG TPA: aconitate hydratase AcnA [Candidatus Poseidoniales archaeon]|nr:aconitate hydratase AcnA [Euryarchaeota archaeon]DAC52634.1 MAG TPA: aconitate hydratase AcnA [Candidatus Poseidoniales archaeon]HII28386.1 aconitate hydratase AcnA [Poseidonia sp.]